MRLTKQTSDAIKVLVLCAKSPDTRLKAAALAEEIGTTKQVGLKLVNLLARQGYVETVRGPSGGIRLANGVETRTIGSIVRDLEALELSQSCAGSNTEKTHRQLEQFVDDAFDAFISVLEGKTIADLAGRRASSSSKSTASSAARKPSRAAVKPTAKPANERREGLR